MDERELGKNDVLQSITDTLNDIKNVLFRIDELQRKELAGKQQSSQPDGPQLTAEEIAGAARAPTLQEVMTHFGYETIGEWSSTWLNMPEQIERLSELPEFIKMLGLDKRYRIIFDYDPTYPKMLLQAIVSDPSQ